jgi:salicylate hydroxylase
VRELLADAPRERLHASKKLAAIDRAPDAVTLHFTDSTTHKCDIVIGADGIHSTLRKLILGENNPAASPHNTGAWVLMSLLPYAEAQAKLGEGLIELGDPREYSWLGHNSYMLHNVLSNGELVQLVIASNDKQGSELLSRWRRVVSAEEIKELYQGWPPHLNNAVNEVSTSSIISLTNFLY